MGTIIKLSGIYVILNLINNKRYVGHSINIKKRWTQHRGSLNRNVSIHIHLQAAWNKYGGENFSFSIVESLPHTLTKEQFEEVETKWVLHFKSHLREFGYNSTLPGSIHLKKEGENITRVSKSLTKYVCINSLSGENIELIGWEEVLNKTGIRPNKVEDLSSYWRGRGRRKSLHGWMVVKKEDYNPLFDYVGYKKEKITNYKYGYRCTATEYYQERRRQGWMPKKKTSMEKVPYKDRNLKRVSILAHNIETGEEKIYPMIKECIKDFDRMKVYKCINNEYGKYKHRGYYFKRL